MSYDCYIRTYSNGQKSWMQHYDILGPMRWHPESKICRILHILLFIPWGILWCAGLFPAIFLLGIIGGSYNYIKYGDFFP